MSRDDPVVRIVKLVDIVYQEPPAIITTQRLIGMGGRSRTFSHRIVVPHRELFRRLASEAAKGDDLEITTITDWTSPKLRTVLRDFRVVRVVDDGTQRVGTAPN